MQLGDIVGKVTANIKDFEAKMDTVVTKSSETTAKSSKVLSGIGTAMKGVGTVALGAVATASTAILAITTASIKAYADYEQLAGGVVKLFGKSSTEVIANAERAYKTAGMSANDYMETVTSFSASLLQSLGGDTVKATNLSDQAIQDMSDNANTFGTNVEMIKNAYQGFAKDNFTMLDNLKLGYGGTAGEMARLVNDSGVMGKTFKATAENVNSIGFDKYVQAIHKIQEETNITGTTAKEASGTITGSLNAMKGSWENLLVAFASGNEDVVTTAFNNLGESLGDFMSNILNVLPKVLSGLTQGIEQLFTSVDISALITGLVEQIPKIVELAVTLITALVNGLKDNLPLIIESSITIISTLINGIIELLPVILQMGIDILVSLMEGLTKMMPELIPLIVDTVLLMAKTLIDNLPLIIESGIELIIALLMGIIEAIPDLIDYIPLLIESIVGAIIQLLPWIIYAGLRIIVELAKGLIVAIPKLVAMIPQILDAIAKGIGNNIGTMWESGKELIAGLWEGIKNSGTWIKDKLKNWVGDVTQFIKNLFGIASPSKLMEKEVGFNLGAGIANGIKGSANLVEKAMNGLDDLVTTAINPMISPNISASGLGSIAGGGLSLNIDMSGANISSPEIAQDYAEKIGDAIVGKLRTARRSYG